MKYRFLLYAFAIFLLKNESAWAYTVEEGEKYISFFKIEGCDKDWCQIVERTPYNITINMTMAADLDYPLMTYTISDVLKTKSYGTGPMPLLCGSMTEYSKCPLKAKERVTYFAPFTIVTPHEASSVLGSVNGKKLLEIDFYYNKGKRNILMFSISVPILFQGCLLHVMC